jgi:hypothetical protein
MTSGSIWLACGFPQASASRSYVPIKSASTPNLLNLDVEPMAIVDNDVTSAVGTVLSSLKASKRQLGRSDVRQEHRHTMRGGKVWVGGLGQVFRKSEAYSNWVVSRVLNRLAIPRHLVLSSSPHTSIIQTIFSFSFDIILRLEPTTG